MYRPIIITVIISGFLVAPDIIAFQRANYLEPSAGAIRGDFTLGIKLGHMFTERFAIEVGGSFTPKTQKERSAIVYRGGLRVSLREVSPLENSSVEP